MNRVNERSGCRPATRMTAPTLAAMWIRQRLSTEMIALDDLLTDLSLDCEIGVRAIVAEAAVLLGSVYAEMPTMAEEALDLMEETAAAADNELYATANAMLRPG